MRIGALRYLIAIEQQVITQDPIYGTDIIEWVVLATVWANITYASGREYMESNMALSATMTKIHLRYRPDLDTTMRIKHNGTVYNIEAILPDDRRTAMTIMCAVSSAT